MFSTKEITLYKKKGKKKIVDRKVLLEKKMVAEVNKFKKNCLQR